MLAAEEEEEPDSRINILQAHTHEPSKADAAATSGVLQSGQEEDPSGPPPDVLSRRSPFSRGAEQRGAQLEGWQRDWKAQGIKSNPGRLEPASSHLCLGSVLVLRCLRSSRGNNRLIKARVKKLLNGFVSHPFLPDSSHAGCR